MRIISSDTWMDDVMQERKLCYIFTAEVKAEDDDGSIIYGYKEKKMFPDGPEYNLTTSLEDQRFLITRKPVRDSAFDPERDVIEEHLLKDFDCSEVYLELAYADFAWKSRLESKSRYFDLILRADYLADKSIMEYELEEYRRLWPDED